MAVALRRPGLRLVVVAVALLGGLDALEEYLPVMAADWGVPTAAVPIAVLAWRWRARSVPVSAAGPPGCPPGCCSGC